MTLSDTRRAVVLAEELESIVQTGNYTDGDQGRYLMSDTKSIANRLREILRQKELAKIESFRRAANRAPR